MREGLYGLVSLTEARGSQVSPQETPDGGDYKVELEFVESLDLHGKDLHGMR